MSDTKTIARAAGLIVILSILSKILGFFREMVLAYVFGASANVDAFLVAYTVPNIIFNVLGGALAVVSIPVYASYVAEGKKEEAWRLFSSFSVLISLILMAVVAIGIPLSRQIVFLIAPSLNPNTAQLAASLTVIMLPSVVFLALGNLFYGLLNANKIFGPPAWWTILSNICIITGSLLGLKYGISAPAYGTLAGFIAAMLLQVPFLKKVGFRLYLPINFKHPGIKQIMLAMVPLMIGTGISQIYVIIDRILASGLAEGSIAALNYANKLVYLPQGVIVIALSTAVFPTLADRVAVGQMEEYKRALLRATKLLLMMALPAAVGIAVLRDPIIRLLFARGAFDENAVTMTSFAVLCFSFGLIGQCINPIMTRGFYALQDTGTPVKVGIITVVLTIISALVLVGPLKHGGLALSNSIAATVNFIMLGYILGRNNPGLWDDTLGRFVVLTVLAAGITGIVAWGMDAAVSPHVGQETIGLGIRVLVDILAGAGVFVLSCRVMKIDEYMSMRELGLGYFKRRFLNEHQ